MQLLISGDSGCGKTSVLTRLAAAAVAAGFSVGGVLAPAVHRADGTRAGYDVAALGASGVAAVRELCRASEGAGAGGAAPAAAGGVQRAGRFVFSPDGIDAGLAALRDASERRARVVFFDEVGPLELGGGGWAPALDTAAAAAAAAAADTVFVLAVRPACVAAVRARWRLHEDMRVVELAQGGGDAAVAAAVVAARALLPPAPPALAGASAQ
jgi:nucleoside-triphosphatase THEP1